MLGMVLAVVKTVSLDVGVAENSLLGVGEGVRVTVSREFAPGRDVC